MAMMAATVWFIPGWLRTTEPHEDVLSCVSNVFPVGCAGFVRRLEAREEQGDRPLPHHRPKQASQGMGPRVRNARGG